LTECYPYANYLIRLGERASKKLSLEDQLYKAIAKAQVAIQSLCVGVHYLSCEVGVWRKPIADGTCGQQYASG